MAVDLRAYLAEQGMTAEEIIALLPNEKAVKAMTAALSKSEEGTAALATAQTEREAAKAEKAEAEAFWADKVTPALAGVDRKVATANSEAARYRAYLKSLKDQGYDVPDELLAAPNPVNPANPNPVNPDYMTREEFRKAAAGTAPTSLPGPTPPALRAWLACPILRPTSAAPPIPANSFCACSCWAAWSAACCIWSSSSSHVAGVPPPLSASRSASRALSILAAPGSRSATVESNNFACCSFWTLIASMAWLSGLVKWN